MTKRAGVASAKNLSDAPKVVTANRVVDGAVVFRDPTGGWQRSIAPAAVAEGEEATAALLASAQADVAKAIVMDAYLIDIAPEPAGPRPLALRERIRADGPTVPVTADKPWVAV